MKDLTSIKDLNEKYSIGGEKYSTNAKKYYGGIFGETMYFPQELGDAGNSHYIVFYINELIGGSWEASANARILSDESPVFTRPGSNSSYAMADRFKGLVPKFVSGALVVTGTAAGAVAGGVSAGPVAAVAGGTAGYAATKAVSDDVEQLTKDALDFVAPSYKRTAVCIGLPMPEVLNTSFTAQWGMASAELMNLVALGEDLANTAGESGIWEAIKQGAKRQGVVKFSKFATNLLGNAGNRITKSVNNTRTEMQFDSILNRPFAFQWTLFPKNAEESKAIWDIIQMFKYHMLPEYDEASSGLFINFPNTFDIEIHSNGKRNNWLPKTSTCALTRIDLNYTPGGSFAFFEEVANGKAKIDGSAPVGIIIGLEFMEIDLIYRNRIDPKKDYTFGQGDLSQHPDGGTY